MLFLKFDFVCDFSKKLNKKVKLVCSNIIIIRCKLNLMMDEDGLSKEVGFGGLEQKNLHEDGKLHLPDDLNAFLMHVEQMFDEEFRKELENSYLQSKINEPKVLDETEFDSVTGAEFLALLQDINMSLEEEEDVESTSSNRNIPQNVEEPVILIPLNKIKLSHKEPEIGENQKFDIFLIRQLHAMKVMPNYKSVYIFENHKTEIFSIMGMIMDKVVYLDKKKKVVRLKVYDFSDHINCVLKYAPKSKLKICRDRSENKGCRNNRAARLKAYELTEDPNFDDDDDDEKPPNAEAMDLFPYIHSQKALWKDLVENLVPGDIVAITSKMKERQLDKSRYLLGSGIQKSNFSEFSLFLYKLKDLYMDNRNLNN